MKLILFSLVFFVMIAANIFAQGLEITEIDVSVDYDEAYTYRIERRDRIDSTTVPIVNNTKIDADVLPGSNVTFTIRVENTFSGENPDLRNVFVTINIEEIDDGADLEERSLDFDLEPGNDERVDVKFAIPVDVEAGTYNLLVEAEGDDRNETSYNPKVNLKLEVKKQSHDIRISKIILNPSTVDCDRSAKLTAEIVNAGSNPENEIALEFKATSLGVNSFDTNIVLQSSEEASEEEKTFIKTLNIEVPTFFEAGTFPILINLYWKNFVLFDQKTADLVVRDCRQVTTVQGKEDEKIDEATPGPVVVIKPEEKEEEKPNGIIVATKEFSGLDSALLLAILLGAFVVTLFVIIIIASYFTKSRPQ